MTGIGPARISARLARHWRKTIMASKESAVLGEMYKSWVSTMAENPDMTVEETRRMFEHWGDVTGEPEGVDYIEVDANGVRCMWAKPKGGNETRALLCTHGGGYMVGSMYSHRKMFGHIAKTVGCPALIVDYRRSPEHPHPTPVNDCVRAYEWMLDQGLEAKHIAFTGDSAGGALAITTVLAARDKGLPLPAASMPISPWTDMEITGETVTTNEAKDHFVKRAVIEHMSATFLGENGDRKDPLATPLYADLAGLPPFFVQVGGDETLLDDARRFVAKVEAAGGEAKLDIFPEMQHVFHFLAGTAPEADKAIADQAAWIKPKLGL
ncbi:alpha/beta hydrolase [Microbaculum marinisediminis]|uniref:Alpha/beta hydrolase n=1 Tax=Microbaculum marinisediminis TaxID=2931392 RepID=A0AAW5QZG2_9HYPH|nr:alpha/beta hydrolase [Microbaculum sp. A6E488]MCT8971803.1 alpha/beta hydrolase [Microbaculum sp. A6E488]